jgi:hypothetical protein
MTKKKKINGAIQQTTQLEKVISSTIMLLHFYFAILKERLIFLF